jgi:hypothetical protein
MRGGEKCEKYSGISKKKIQKFPGSFFLSGNGTAELTGYIFI